ncbi:MAG: RluA family pseudouridine synthase [Kofleriaceae bacterium]|nr:RluA family pseudouridine synthase [Kofleriaceae bacterium]
MTTPKSSDAEERDDVDDDVADEIEGAEPAASALELAAYAAYPGVDLGLTSHLDETGKPKIIERHLHVPEELAGLRLDHYVKTQIPRLSRTKIQAIIDTQLRRADGFAPKPATKIAAGDHFIIRRPARAEPPCPRTFTVLHEDARMRVIDKPFGLPVHSTAKFYFNTLTRVMWERYPDEDELQICHRLDRETSGCLVLARDREAAAFLKGAIASKDKTTKQYLAVVHGKPPWDVETTLDIPLRLSTEADATRLPHVRMLPDPRGLSAITKVVVERAGEQYSLVRCTLVTGRQHQIRAHLATSGFPIVGDKIYTHGDDAFIEYCASGLTPALAALFVLPRHALHAARITLPHPNGGVVSADAPLPADMSALL